MVQFDNQYRQIKIKIVYYGPALGGKTTCLQQIHQVTDPQRRTKLYSLNTASDRTLFFDLLSLELGRIRGYRLALQLYTVPGQVQYNATRRAVLSGADGVVFVADSQAEQRQANLDSLENLADNLLANGIDRETVPLVFQYNKRDLPSLMEVDEMNGALNPRAHPAFPSVAVRGEGVIEAFAAITRRTLAAVADRLGVGSNPEAVRRLQEQVDAALAAFAPPTDGAAAEDVAVVRPAEEVEGGKPLSEELLVGEAVRANLAMTDLNARLDTVRRELERKVAILSGIGALGRALAEEHDEASVLRHLVRSLVSLLRVEGAAVLIQPGSGSLDAAELRGLDRDPLLATLDEAGEPLALAILGDREPRLFAPDVDGGDTFCLAAVEAAGFASGLAVPMIVNTRIVGLVTAYATHERIALDEDDLGLASVLAATAAVGYDSASAWRRLEELNRGLEREVEARTDDLRASLAEQKRLASELGEKNRLLEGAYRELAQLDRVKDELIGRISQELKTPVSSLVTAAKILERDAPGASDKSSRFVAIIRAEAEKLSEIIGSVVQASVLTGARGRAETRPCPANELLKDSVAPLRDLAKRHEVSLRVRIPSTLEAIRCEPESMGIALRALLKNAIEFNDRGGEVTVEVRRVARGGDGWLVLKVSDTGVGIPQSDLPHVFDSFWQGSNLVSGHPRGIGLGLTIAKRVAEQHGGELTISSEVAKGTQVTLTIPE